MKIETAKKRRSRDVDEAPSTVCAWHQMDMGMNACFSLYKSPEKLGNWYLLRNFRHIKTPNGSCFYFLDPTRRERVPRRYCDVMKLIHGRMSIMWRQRWWGLTKKEQNTLALAKEKTGKECIREGCRTLWKVSDKLLQPRRYSQLKDMRIVTLDD